MKNCGAFCSVLLYTPTAVQISAASYYICLTDLVTGPQGFTKVKFKRVLLHLAEFYPFFSYMGSFNKQ